jgi:hypothetical protein
MVRWIIVAVVLVVTAGASYQFIGSRMEANSAPEPGCLVDVGGHLLKINCIGSGSPTVVLENGLGGVLVEWQTVHPCLLL